MCTLRCRRPAPSEFRTGNPPCALLTLGRKTQASCKRSALSPATEDSRQRSTLSGAGRDVFRFDDLSRCSLRGWTRGEVETRRPRPSQGRPHGEAPWVSVQDAGVWRLGALPDGDAVQARTRKRKSTTHAAPGHFPDPFPLLRDFATFAACLPNAVRVFFGSLLIVFFALAAFAALPMLRRAAAFCFAVAMVFSCYAAGCNSTFNQPGRRASNCS